MNAPERPRAAFASLQSSYYQFRSGGQFHDGNARQLTFKEFLMQHEHVRH